MPQLVHCHCVVVYIQNQIHNFNLEMGVEI